MIIRRRRELDFTKDFSGGFRTRSCTRAFAENGEDANGNTRLSCAIRIDYRDSFRYLVRLPKDKRRQAFSSGPFLCLQERAGETAEIDDAQEDPVARHPGPYRSGT